MKSGYFAAHQFSLSGYIISSSPSTLPQSRSGIVHFLDISVVAGYSALSSAVAPLLVQAAIAAVKTFNGIGSVYDLSDLCRKLEYR